MKKRILALLMALVMTLLCFAGCGSDDVSESSASSSGKKDSVTEDSETGDNVKDDGVKNVTAAVVFAVDVSASTEYLRDNAVALMTQQANELKSSYSKIQLSIIAYGDEVVYQSDFNENCSKVIEDFVIAPIRESYNTDTSKGMLAAADMLNTVEADAKVTKKWQ